MKIPKNVVKNNEMTFWYPVIDNETNKLLLGNYVGAVEIVVDGYQSEEGWEYVTEYFLAYQLISGRVVAVEGPVETGLPCNVFSLKGKLYDIRWGFYPVDFPKGWQYYKENQPEANCANAVVVENDQLPF